MAEFWNSFLDIVSLLLCFIRSIRLGNWELHLSCIREMLPWIHIYDRVNYARYLPYYWIQMITLKDTHPQAYSELKNGAFAVQRPENSGFSQIAVDHTIEQTVNHDTKTKGGIIGFSLKKGALERWLLTAHERAKICQNLYTMASIKQSDSLHKEDSAARRKRDEDDVQNVIGVIKSWANPLKNSEDLVGLSSGARVKDEIARDLLQAHSEGEKAAKAFMEERLISNNTDFLNQ